MERAWLFFAGFVMSIFELGVIVLFILGLTEVTWVMPPLGSFLTILLMAILYFCIVVLSFFYGANQLRTAAGNPSSKVPPKHFLWHFIWCLVKESVLLTLVSLYYQYERDLGTPTTTDLGVFIWYKIIFAMTVIFALSNLQSFQCASHIDGGFKMFYEKKGIVQKSVNNRM
jgi:hypothetical protein